MSGTTIYFGKINLISEHIYKVYSNELKMRDILLDILINFKHGLRYEEDHTYLGGDGAQHSDTTSLDDMNAKLKEFEGVDVKDLQGRITKLQGDLKAKDDEYAAKEADRVFMDSIKEAVKTAGGRNEKAVIAMLDIDALKESKNQSADIKKALEDVKKSDGYLFGANEPINNAVGGTNISGGADPGADDVSAIRAAMGLPEKK